MEIIVTLKQVPDPEAPKENFRIDEADMRILNPSNVDPVINGYDENAIEAALQIKEANGGKVTAEVKAHGRGTKEEWGISLLAKPATERSPGTSKSNSRAAESAPMAIGSLLAKMAVGRDVDDSRVRAHRYPES